MPVKIQASVLCMNGFIVVRLKSPIKLLHSSAPLPVFLYLGGLSSMFHPSHGRSFPERAGRWEHGVHEDGCLTFM